MSTYPHETDIEKIKSWDYRDLTGLLTFVESIWAYAEWGWRRRGRTYRVSTAGWSGNEEIIGALKENFMFWSVCWQSSRRGGHYVFKVPVIKELKHVDRDRQPELQGRSRRRRRA